MQKRMRWDRGYDASARSEATGLDTGEESLVQQQFRDELDINTIVRRFGIEGAMPLPGMTREGVYGDFTGVTDFRSAMERIEAARAGFMELPPEVREKYNNDVLDFLEAVDGLEDDELEGELGFSQAASEPEKTPEASQEPPEGGEG